MKLRRRPTPRPLLSPALRRPAALVVTGCAAVTASLALAFAGQTRPDGLDAAVDAHTRSALSQYQGQLHQLAELGGLAPVTMMTAALVLACLATRRWRGAALACLAVPAAVTLTEYVLKPLVGRTILSGYDCYPSGHTTALFALAATCTVLLTGLSAKSCAVLAVQADGAEITTIQGLANGELHPLQRAFHEEHALQCGYCTPGMIMAASDLIEKNPDPSEEEVREALAGNLCRCTGYHNIVKAVLSAAKASGQEVSA